MKLRIFIGLACFALSACGRSVGVAAPASASEAPPLAPMAAETLQRPGPEILYAAAPAAPQLENVAPWSAEPILVSGASAYRSGEFLYQDFLYDDHGVRGTPDPADPMSLADFALGYKTGTLTYPDDPVYANNAADLVELRVKPLADASAFRVTLNTMIAPERSAFTIALGDSTELRDWPHGAGVRSPAQFFLTVHGATAELRDAASGDVLAPGPTVSVDIERRQFDLRVPHAAWNPGQAQVRISAGVGLWDEASDAYLAPGFTRSASAPGGGQAGGAALFNLAFRYDEPMPYQTLLPVPTPVDGVGRVLDFAWWREQAQAGVLASGDISRFHAMVDFARLAAQQDDESGVPQSGPINRILASRFSAGQGVDYSRACGRFPITCDGMFIGQLQPYALYVPERVPPVQGWGLTLLLHALSTNYNFYLNGNWARPLGERGAGSLVVTPSSRGPDGDYTDVPEADLFEVWADVARHYPLDPEWVTSAGYSMGGGATYKMLTRWPDLFARGMGGGAVPLAEQGGKMENLRHTPLMLWVGALDEGTPPPTSLPARSRLAELGLHFVFDFFLTMDHLALPANEVWTGVAEFLGEHRVVRDPPHITYIVDPRFDSVRAGMVADHAYWLSGLRVRDAATDPTAMIDAVSQAFGLGDAPPSGVSTSYGLLESGNFGPLPYERQQQGLGPPPAMPIADRLVLQARNLASVTVDVRRARLSCNPQLDVSSDGPLEIQLAGCDRVIHAGS